MDVLAELEKGANLHAAGNISQANSIYSEILINYPKHQDALNLKGILMRDSGQLSTATQLFLKALENAPHRPDFHYNLAELYRIENSLNKAIESYDKSLVLNPAFYEAIYNRALCLMDAGLNLQAIEGFKNSLEVKIDVSAVVNLLTLLISENDFSQVKKVSNNYRSLNHSQIFNALGMAEKAMGNLQRAQRHLQKALNLDGKNIDILNNLALIYKKNGLLKEAAELLETACSMCPTEAFLHYNLAGIYNLSEQKGKAVEHYKRSIKYDPHNESAIHMLNAIKGNNTDSAPEKYIENLFDLYASSFEEDLVQKLKYNIPNELAILVKECKPDRVFENALDAGCGTGLCALAFKDIYKKISGIDLSPKMIQKASEKKLYTKLITGELTDSMKSFKSKYDLILAADVFIYLGNLSAFFEVSSRLTSDHGVLAFSVENCEESYQLQPSGRYSHSHTYLKNLAQEYSFEIESIKNCQIRKDMGKWIEGRLYLLKKK